MSPNVLADDFDPEVLFFFKSPSNEIHQEGTVVRDPSQDHPADTLACDVACFEGKK